MPTKKIKDYKNNNFCTNPEHNPPGLQVFEPGEYEHTCPDCGSKQNFTVPNIIY